MVCPMKRVNTLPSAQRRAFKVDAFCDTYGPSRSTLDGLANRTGQPPAVARELLRQHREEFQVFWRWSDAALDCAMLTGRLHTVFGWHVHVGIDANPRSLRNFPMQADGAEMLPLARCLGVEAGIEVCAPVHDAVLIAAPLERLDQDIARMQDVMREASRVVLDGFELGMDAKIIPYPDRYADPRGEVMWDRVIRLIGEQDVHLLGVIPGRKVKS